MGRYKDLTGQQFGYLHVLCDVGRRGGSVVWRCLCMCGTETNVVGAQLVRGHTRSCGCLSIEHSRDMCLRREIRRKHPYVDHTDKRFGRLLVLAAVGRSTCRRVLWSCLCDCGNTVTVTSMALLRGYTRSCGCLRKEHAGKQALHNIQYHIHTGKSQSATMFLDAVEKLYGVVIEREVNVGGRLFDGSVGKVLLEVDGEYWHTLNQTDAIKTDIALRNGYILERFIVNEKREVVRRLQQYTDRLYTLFGHSV